MPEYSAARETAFRGILFNRALERIGEVAAAKAAYDAAVANYRGTVPGAPQNVEDDLASVRVLAGHAAVLERAVADARHGADIKMCSDGQRKYVVGRWPS